MHKLTVVNYDYSGCLSEYSNPRIHSQEFFFGDKDKALAFKDKLEDLNLSVEIEECGPIF